MIKKLSKALDELPSAYDQLWLFVLPRSSAPLDGVRSQGVTAHQCVVNVEVLDLTDERDKITSDIYPGADPNRRLGILPSLSAWVRYTDEEMIKQKINFIPPYRFVACGGSCRFTEDAEIAAGDELGVIGLRVYVERVRDQRCPGLNRQDYTVG